MIELQEARDLLNRAVETQGRDFVYNPKEEIGGGCFYVPTNPENVDKYSLPTGFNRQGTVSQDSPKWKTGCLIGVALDLAGLDFHHISLTRISAVQGVYNHLSQSAIDYFQEAQNLQDQGATWGESYDAAERSVS